MYKSNHRINYTETKRTKHTQFSEGVFLSNQIGKGESEELDLEKRIEREMSLGRGDIL